MGLSLRFYPGTTFMYSKLNILISLTIFCCLSAIAESSSPLKIGFIAPLTGSAASYGVAAKNGFELALNELKSSKPIVIYEDDRFDPKQTISAFHKLVGTDKVDVLISIASAPSAAIAPLAQARGIPLFAWASDTTVSKDRGFVIRTYPSGSAEGVRAGQNANKLRYKKVASFVSINAYPLSVRDGILEELKSNVVYDEQTPPDITDFKPLLLNAKKTGADSLFICLNPGQSGLFASQAREMKMNQPIFGCINLESASERDLSKGALVGAWFVTVDVKDDFRKKYMAEYKNDEMLSGAGIHFDLLNDLVRFQKLRMKDLLNAFLTTPSSGAMGEYKYTKQSEDQSLEIPLLVKEIQTDKFLLQK